MRRVFDINVAKPQLQSPSVMPRIGQQMPTRVPEHVRVALRVRPPPRSSLRR